MSGRACPACWMYPSDRVTRLRFPPLQRAQVVALACLEPVARGLHITHWSSDNLARQVVADAIIPSIGARTIRRILHEVDLQPHRTRYWKTARLDDRFKVLWCYANAARLARRWIWVVCADEVPNFQALERVLIREGTRPARAPGAIASGAWHGDAPLWRHAVRLWDQATSAETAWNQAKSAFEFFTPDGCLNDRSQAEAVVAAALWHLGSEAWGKTRRLLLRRESFRFLDQVQDRLAGLGLDAGVLSALLDLKGLRRQPWRESAATDTWALVRTVQLTKACPTWQDQASRVRAVLRGVWRASSLVECVNSVARMQQARKRKITQGLLELKRLYWNLRRFRTGRRKGQMPYVLLGSKLPELSFWEFLSGSSSN